MSHTASQQYLSTRGGSSGLSFEHVVLKGLADDGGLFIPEQIPSLPDKWSTKWRDLSFEQLAYEVFALYISSSEIAAQDLKNIIQRSYRTFRRKEISPLICLDPKKDLYLLELIHGPTYAFKDVALHFLGNLFEFFLGRKNEGKTDEQRSHLTVIGATSGDTGSAAIYGLRAKSDISIFMLFPGPNKVSKVQESQMTSIPDSNVHNIMVDGSFDDCQDTVKALFANEEINKTHKLGAVNSINWFAKRMGLPCSRLVIATNSNDILHRFMTTGTYEKQPVHSAPAPGDTSGARADPSGVKMTWSPAMDILVSSNFERLLAFLAFEFYSGSSSSEPELKLQIGRSQVSQWLRDLKTNGGFTVDPAILAAAKRDFSSECVDDEQTIDTIRHAYSNFFPKGVASSEGTTGKTGGYILDPHSAVGVAASLRPHTPAEHTISLATAHPAKFNEAVDRALHGREGYNFDDVLPHQLKDILHLEKRFQSIGNERKVEKVKSLIMEKIPTSAT